MVFCGCSGGGGAPLDANATTTDAPAGANTITGAVDGHRFDQVQATLWAGSPDNPSTDTVIYLFDHPVAYEEIAATGWDTRITAGTEALCATDACTDLGTNPGECGATGVVMPSTTGAAMICPCHGSTFTIAGTVITGPAVRSLPHYAVVFDGNDALVDVSQTVDPLARAFA